MSTSEDRTSGASGMAGQQAAGLLGGEVREGYAEIGDVRLHYVEAGDGPLIVLLHGFPEFWYGRRLQLKPSFQARLRGGGQAPPPVTVPVAFSAFPGEIFQAPRSWVELGYPTLSYYTKPARGGHFAAWEEPQLFTEELRAAFRSLR